jgi:hypothetical protein
VQAITKAKIEATPPAVCSFSRIRHIPVGRSKSSICGYPRNLSSGQFNHREVASAPSQRRQYRGGRARCEAIRNGPIVEAPPFGSVRIEQQAESSATGELLRLAAGLSLADAGIGKRVTLAGGRWLTVKATVVRR